MMFDINPIKKNKIILHDFINICSIYHLAKLIIRIDEIKFTEKIVVDQKHELTTCPLGTCFSDNLSVGDRLVGGESDTVSDNDNSLFE
jgi:hypothetical protein